MPTGVSIYQVITQSILHEMLVQLFPGDDVESFGIAAAIEGYILTGQFRSKAIERLLEASKKSYLRMTLPEIQHLCELTLKSYKLAIVNEPILIYRTEVSMKAYSEWARNRLEEYLGSLILRLDPKLVGLVIDLHSGDSGFVPISLN